jgi:DNA-binding transcriptional LysR family regulator
MDPFRNMDIFVEVAKAGGFRLGAKALNIPISTVSRRIAELERDIGLRLFKRTTRRMELTDVGRLYFDRCRRLVEEAKMAHEELTATQGNVSGLIRAMVPIDFSFVYLNSIVADFLRLNPGIRFELDLSARPVNLVSDPFDFAIRMSAPTDMGIIARKIAEIPIGLFASPEYLAARGTPRTPADLLQHDCLLLSEWAWPWRLTPASGDEPVYANVKGPIVTNNLGSLIQLAMKHLGIVLVFRERVRLEVDEGRLVPLLPDWEPTSASVYVLTETRLLPARVRVFISYLIERLAVVTR